MKAHNDKNQPTHLPVRMAMPRQLLPTPQHDRRALARVDRLPHLVPRLRAARTRGLARGKTSCFVSAFEFRGGGGWAEGGGGWWHCFGDGEGGKGIDVWMDVEMLSCLGRGG